MLIDVESLINNCEKYRYVELYNECCVSVTYSLYHLIYEFQKDVKNNLENIVKCYFVIWFLIKSPFPFPQAQVNIIIKLIVDLYIFCIYMI